MSDHGAATNAIHAGHSPDASSHARAVPIYQTSSFVFDSSEHAAKLFSLAEFGNIYTRLMNPTTDVLERRIATLEGGTGGLATASGMAAIFTAVSTIAQAGDHIVSSSSLYGGTDTFFRYTCKRMGIDVTFIEDMTPADVTAAITPDTKIVYLETIGNPKGDVLDLRGIADAAHAQGVVTMIDNTFAPIICKPIDHGIDIVIHSCTKWIGGHGTSIGGMIVDSGNFQWNNGRYPEFTEPDHSYHGLVYWDALSAVPGMGNVAFIIKARVQTLRNTGACISPTNAFHLLQGAETLPLRMQRHGENTLALTTWLKAQPEVAWVTYTGLPEHPSHEMAGRYLSGGYGSVFGFGLKGGYEASVKFIDNVKLASHLANVGDAKTLVLHPASTSHQQLDEAAQRACGLTPDFIRVSVGIEDIADIQADFAQAIQAAT